MERAGTFNRRTLDAIAARIYFYYAWAHEKTGQLGAVRRCGNTEEGGVRAIAW